MDLNFLVLRTLSEPDRRTGVSNRTRPEHDLHVTLSSHLPPSATFRHWLSREGKSKHNVRKRIPDIADTVSQGLIVYLNIALKDSFPFFDFAQKNKLRRLAAAERNLMMNGARSPRQRDLAEDSSL